jgi:multiple sugar transport system permease protein
MFSDQRRTKRVLNTLSYVVIIGVCIFALAPIVWTFLTSLKPTQDILTRDLQYFPRNVTIENYINIWQRSGFPTLITNSIITTIWTLVFCLSIGSLAGYAFSRFRFKGRTPLLLFYLMIRMFPVVLLIIPLFIIMRDLSLLDKRHGLALAYTTFLMPLSVWLMKGFFDAIPVDLEEAARIDGCTRLSALIRIVLPLTRSGFIATAVFIGVAAWNEYLFALMLTTSQGSRTWPVGIQLMVGEFQLEWGQFSAGGILSIIPVFVFFSIVQRSLIRGISAGAVKG